MEDLRCISLHFYFKVLDADMYGGEGSIGFAGCSANECIKDIDNCTTVKGFDVISEKYRAYIAMQMKVPTSKVIPISRTEYKNNTEEDEE